MSDTSNSTITSLINLRKEQFSVEIRKQRHQSILTERRKCIGKNLEVLIGEQFFSSTPAAIIYQQAVEELREQISLKNEELLESHFKYLESIHISCNELSQISSASEWYNPIIKSLVFAIAYLRIHIMTELNISQKLINSLASLANSYKEAPNPENYFITSSSLQLIGCISFFPIDINLFQDNLLSVIIWSIKSNIPELCGNGLFAINIIAQADAYLKELLIERYDLIEVMLESLNSVDLRLKLLLATSQSRQSPQSALQAELLNQILTILQDVQQMQYHSVRKDKTALQQAIIQNVCKVFQNWECLSNYNLNICAQIIRFGINTATLRVHTFECMQLQNVFSYFFEVINNRTKMLNHGEESSEENNQIFNQMVQLMINIICTISSLDDITFSSAILPNLDYLDVLISLLLNEKNNINVLVAKILFNLGVDMPDYICILANKQQFWENLQIVTSLTQKKDFMNEILILMEIVLEEVYIQNKIESINVFLQAKGLQIFLSILNLFQNSEHIIICFDQLSILLNFVSNYCDARCTVYFIMQCEEVELFQVAQSFLINRKSSENENLIFRGTSIYESASRFLDFAQKVSKFTDKQIDC